MYGKNRPAQQCAGSPYVSDFSYKTNREKEVLTLFTVFIVGNSIRFTGESITEISRKLTRERIFLTRHEISATEKALQSRPMAEITATQRLTHSETMKEHIRDLSRGRFYAPLTKTKTVKLRFYNGLRK